MHFLGKGFVYSLVVTWCRNLTHSTYNHSLCWQFKELFFLIQAILGLHQLQATSETTFPNGRIPRVVRPTINMSGLSFSLSFDVEIPSKAQELSPSSIALPQLSQFYELA